LYQKKNQMKNKIFTSIFASIIVAVTIIACDDTVTNEDIDSVVIPSSNVSFNKYILPLFQVKCNNANCHSSSGRAGSLSLDSYAGATSNGLDVFPGVPDNSKLVWAIEGRSVSPMPPIGYPPLIKNQITGIRTWIKEGAKNN
jgi:hypothetical protein